MTPRPYVPASRHPVFLAAVLPSLIHDMQRAKARGHADVVALDREVIADIRAEMDGGRE